jgi:hypothetical protein
MTEDNGLHEMNAPAGTFIQFACAANQTVSNDLFTKHLLKNIAQENVDVSSIFEDITNKVYHESNRQQRPFFRNGLHQHRQVYLNGKYFLDREIFVGCQSVGRQGTIERKISRKKRNLFSILHRYIKAILKNFCGTHLYFLKKKNSECKL